MKLFQYAIIFKPNDKKEKAKLLVDLKTVLAPDAQAATLMAAREIPSDFIDKLDEIEVAVRPF